MPDRTPVIAGIGLSDYPKAPDLDTIGHHALAMQRALADSGVAKADIDGYLNAGSVMTDDAVTMAEYLGIGHRFIDGTMTGGSSFEFHVQHAAAAIRDGACDTVLVTYGSDYLSRLGRTLGTGGFLRQGQAVGGPMQFEAPYGNTPGRRLRHGRPAPHARVRHHVRSSWPRSPSACASTPASTRTPCTAIR